MRPLKRLVALVLTVGAGAGAIVAVAVAPAIASSTSGTPTIKLTKFPGTGKILTVKGFVVYRFSHDGKGSKNTCVKIRGCPGAWPALTTTGTPHVGPGVNKALLGTTKLPNGKKQVTYAGHPIYKYAFGQKGSTAYVGIHAFGGFWYGVNAQGKSVR
jgi:predicted lipoprotein with Yx(FWY)xxD motif